jgi:hypothetical protein
LLLLLFLFENFFLLRINPVVILLMPAVALALVVLQERLQELHVTLAHQQVLYHHPRHS